MPREDSEPTGMYELLEAIETVIKASNPEKREALAATVDAYADDFPEEFFWATGAQAPNLLAHIMLVIDGASRGEGSKPRAVLRLADRKTEDKPE